MSDCQKYLSDTSCVWQNWSFLSILAAGVQWIQLGSFFRLRFGKGFCVRKMAVFQLAARKSKDVHQHRKQAAKSSKFACHNHKIPSFGSLFSVHSGPYSVHFGTRLTSDSNDLKPNERANLAWNDYSTTRTVGGCIGIQRHFIVHWRVWSPFQFSSRTSGQLVMQLELV